MVCAFEIFKVLPCVSFTELFILHFSPINFIFHLSFLGLLDHLGFIFVSWFRGVCGQVTRDGCSRALCMTPAPPGPASLT